MDYKPRLCTYMHTMLGLPNLPLCTAKPSSGWLYHMSACKVCLTSDWAVIAS